MRNVREVVEALGGMAQKRQLVARGAGDLDLTRAVKRREVIRARQGWYTTLPHDDLRVRAVRVGGRLTGISAIEASGGWVLGAHPLHVSLRSNAARLRGQWNRRSRISAADPAGAVLHWDPFELSQRGSSTSVALEDALVRVVIDETLEQAVAAFDWAFAAGQLDEIGFETVILRLPANRRFIRTWIDPRCDSLPESLARTRLRMRGHEVASQVRLDTLESIDLVVDGCVALETDGEQFHLRRFERDRMKDLTMTIAGLHALRASARSVFNDWPTVQLALETAVSARRPDLHFENSGFRPPPVRTKRRDAALARALHTRSPEFPVGGTAGRGNSGRGSVLEPG